MIRREFLALMTTTAAGALVPPAAFASSEAARPRSVQDVVDLLIRAAVPHPFPASVDTIKTGDPSQPLTGVVTTFMPSVAVIREAIALKANLIVTHEPTFYNHQDDIDWLEADAVYQGKRRLLDDHGIVTFRYHDYIHALRPDPVIQATAQQLGWDGAAAPDNPRIFTLASRSLEQLAQEVKTRLGASQIRVIGDRSLEVKRIGLLVGASGGRSHIRFLSAHPVDALVVGEIAEWETSEYVRDANQLGRPLGLIVTGHSVSEALGMKWLAEWLRPQLPDVAVRYVEAPSPF